MDSTAGYEMQVLLPEVTEQDSSVALKVTVADVVKTPVTAKKAAVCCLQSSIDASTSQKAGNIATASQRFS